MAAIRLQFVAESGLASATIGWFSAGHLSHVDAMLPDGRLYGARSDNVGGAPPGVWERPADYARFARRVVATLACDDRQYLRWRIFLRDQRGKPYDRLAILAFAANRNWREDDSWICSELQARALEIAGIVPPLYLAANKITPVALALAVSALPTAIVSEAPAARRHVA